LGGGISAEGAQDTITEVDPPFVCNSIRTLLWLFPSLAGVELLRSWVRYEAVTPDDRFLVGQSPVPGLFLAAGDGGSGFGRSPAVARAVADMLDRKVPPFDASLWAPDRFQQKRAA
jgi:glycine/D-amino acid oxidase-like deaminating enzyme